MSKPFYVPLLNSIFCRVINYYLALFVHRLDSIVSVSCSLSKVRVRFCLRLLRLLIVKFVARHLGFVLQDPALPALPPVIGKKDHPQENHNHEEVDDLLWRLVLPLLLLKLPQLHSDIFSAFFAIFSVGHSRNLT